MADHQNTPPWLRIENGKAVLKLKLVARAKRSVIVGSHGDRLKIAVAAPPVEGRANAALVDFLSEALHIPRRDIEIVSGLRSTQKAVAITGLNHLDLLARLDVR